LPLAAPLEASRRDKLEPDWPVLWDCDGIGFGRVESRAAPISPRTINSVLERARASVGLEVHLTAHIARHTYCTNWILTYGDGEVAIEKLSRQVGVSVAVLRSTYVHVTLSDQDWADIRGLGQVV